MRIIIGHDYYDSVLAYGRDTDVVFVRNDRIFNTSEIPLFAGCPIT